MKNEIKKDILQSAINTAQIHAKRMKYAEKKLTPYFPLSAEAVLAINEDEIPIFELYTSRFSKLQDLMGNTLFPELLEAVGDLNEGMTFIDKLNRLEKLGVIDNTERWMQMRQIRNHLSHEYPDQPDLTADYLNYAFQYGKELLQCLERAVEFIQRKDVLPVI